MMLLLIGLLPASPSKNRMLNFVGRGWQIHADTHFGPTLLLGVERFATGAGTRIGFANVFRDLRTVELGAHVAIGQFNWFSAALYLVSADGDAAHASLVCGDYCLIVSRHYVDCTGGVVLGADSGFAGLRTTVLTHSVDMREDRMQVETLRFGDHSVVFACSTLLVGAELGDWCFVAAGSVVQSRLTESYVVYGGAPAKRIARCDDWAVINRRPSMTSRHVAVSEHKQRKASARRIRHDA
jgi:acetyltransferase-like isoleucine patch superfamily enzyme